MANASPFIYHKVDPPPVQYIFRFLLTVEWKFAEKSTFNHFLGTPSPSSLLHFQILANLEKKFANESTSSPHKRTLSKS